MNKNGNIAPNVNTFQNRPRCIRINKDEYFVNNMMPRGDRRFIKYLRGRSKGTHSSINPSSI